MRQSLPQISIHPGTSKGAYYNHGHYQSSGSHLSKQQTGIWRMSMNEGKATLLKSTAKKDMVVQPVNKTIQLQTWKVAQACPEKLLNLYE